MTLNLLQLKELMSPLAQICKKEREVSVVGIKVTLRYLTPKEELEVQRLLPPVEEGTSALEFADVFRRETLSRSIVQVADLDLRSITEVDTGKSLPNGTSVKVSKEEAVIQMMESWSKQLINKLFEHYGLLSEDIEKNLDDSLKMNIDNAEVEKENLKERIDQLDRSEKLADLEDEEVS